MVLTVSTSKEQFISLAFEYQISRFEGMTSHRCRVVCDHLHIEGRRSATDKCGQRHLARNPTPLLGLVLFCLQRFISDKEKAIPFPVKEHAGRDTAITHACAAVTGL